MLGRIAACLLAFSMSATVVNAEGRSFLGFGNLLVNDAFADGHDRWRTGSYATSRVWGYGWDGRLPEKAGDILEFRFGGEIISPSNINSSGSGDRPWAGAFAWGMHTHFRRGATEFSVGADLVAIGPMTYLDELQKAIHDFMGIAGPSDSVLAAQIPNTWTPRVVLEMGRPVDLGDTGVLHPFVEARAGDETLLRAGFDVTIGRFGQGDLLVRDWVTGFRYRAVKTQQPGMSFVFGADSAKVFDSVYLPSDRGFQLTDARNRVRMGLHVQNKKSHTFYGISWLGEEFVGQKDSQVVGALRIDWQF